MRNSYASQKINICIILWLWQGGTLDSGGSGSHKAGGDNVTLVSMKDCSIPASIFIEYIQ